MTQEHLQSKAGESLELWSQVDAYLVDQLVRPSPDLTSAQADSDAAGLPAIAVSPNLGQFLHILARACRARRILEIGTLAGYSTIWLARSLPPDGRLITLEFEPRHAAIARMNIARAGVGDRVEIRIGAALDLLPRLSGNFDFIFIDADKARIPEYFEWSLRLAQPGTLIVVDNVIRDGAVIDGTSADENVQGVRRFNERVAAEPRVIATALQTVGCKGYDGFALLQVIA